MQTPKTRAEIRNLLLTNDFCVERAMVVLYERQTESEQSASITMNLNGRGFNSSDASKGSYYARWVKSGRRLTGSYLERARAMSLKYTRQLLEAAEAKAAKKARAEQEKLELEVRGKIQDEVDTVDAELAAEIAAS